MLIVGEVNGTPLQYSCLENPMDGGAWWAAVHGVARSQTPLKRLSSRSSSEGEERDEGIKNVFEEIMIENMPNLKKKTDF